MLLPALSKAREKARAITCVSNMKQLGTGAIMYIDENAGFPPPCDSGAGVAPYWMETMLNSRYSSSNKNPSGPYFDLKILLCPTATKDNDWRYFVSYAINWSITNRNFSHNISEMKSPSLKMLFIEGAQFNAAGTAANGKGFWRWFANHTNLADTGWGFPSTRHNSQCNTLHLDGHVQQFRVPNISNPIAAFPFLKDDANSKPYTIWNE